MRDITAAQLPYYQAVSKEPRYVIEISFNDAGTDLVYLTSHPSTPVPGGATQVYQSVIKNVTGTTQQLYVEEGRATIGTISFDVVDYQGQFSTLLATKLAAGKGFRRRRVRVYTGFLGLTWTDFSTSIAATQLVDKWSQEKGAYSVKCADIQRSARTDIFEPAVTHLSGNMTATQLLVPVYSTAGFTLVQHGNSYSDAPSATVLYLKVEDEVIRCTGTTTDGTLGLCFVVDTNGRGVLGSRAAIHEIDTSTSSDNKTEVKEFIYLEMPAIKLAYAILTGSLYNQSGATLPATWSLGISSTLIRASDFVNIGTDLWNPANDQEGVIVRFAGEESQDAKKFIEQQLYLLCACYPAVYSTGEWGVRKFSSVLSDAAPLLILNEDAVVSERGIEIDATSVNNVISIEWNYDFLQGKTTRQKILVDQTSIDRDGETPPKSLVFKGLHGSRHTTAAVESLFNRIRDRFASPPIKMKLRLMPRYNNLEVGDIVQVSLKNIRDPFKGGSLNRSFEIQQVNTNWFTGMVEVSLFGSTMPASVIVPGVPANGADQSLKVMADTFYTTHGVNITTLGAACTTTLTSGVRHITGGTGFVGNDNINSAIIYCDGDLELNSGVTLPWTKNVMLIVKGHLQINGKFDGKGRGKAGAAQVSPVNFDAHGSGTPGFIGPTVSAGGYYDEYVVVSGPSNNQTYENSVPGFSVNGQVSAIPMLTLAYDSVGNALRGYPADLQGTGGSTGRNTDYDYAALNFVAGGAGGAGGAGLIIVARGISFGAAGQIDLSGADGGLGNINGDGRAGSGAGGAPGACYFIIDGVSNEIPDLSHVVAIWGKSPIPTGHSLLSQPRVMTKTTSTVNITPPFYTYYIGFGDNPPDMSGYGSAARAVFIPPVATAVADTPAMASKAAAIALQVFPNVPRTLAGDRTSIEVDITPPSDTNYKYSNIYYLKDGGALTYVGATTSSYVFNVLSDGANYEVRAYSVSKTEVESTDYVTASVTLSNTAAAVLATVTGLALEQAFVGQSAKMKWTAVDGAESYAVAIYAGSPTQVLKRTIDVGNVQRYEYTYEDAIADGGPWRDIQFQVRGKSPTRTSGSWAVVNASNPQMTVPTGLQIGSIARTFTFAVAKPTATDYAGTIFAMSATSGFDPLNTATWIYNGPDVSVTRSNVTPGSYYLRAAHYDTFGTDSLVWCAEQSVSIVDTSSFAGVPTVANASVLTTLSDPQHEVVLSLHNNHVWVWNGTSAYFDTADGANFVANSIAANKLTVAILSAISANLGTVTAGLFKTDTGTGYRAEIEGGHTLPFWLGSNSKTTGNALFYIDTAGNIVARGLQIVGASSGYANLSDRPSEQTIFNNLERTDSWIPGGTLPWNSNASGQSSIVSGFGPKGGATPLWRAATTGGSAADGGWTDGGAHDFKIDTNKIYRFSVAVKLGSGNTGNVYLGCAPNKVCDLNTTTQQGNPYFCVASRSLLGAGTDWYLMVGYVFPAGSTGNSHSGAGIYNMTTGQKVSGTSDLNFCWHSGETVCASRAFMYYATNAGDITYFAPPLVQLCDGTESSISELLPSVTDQLNYGVTITSGGINLNSGGAIYGGTSNPGAGAGVYLGWYSGAYHLLAGNYSTEKYMHFDGSDLILGKNTKLLGTLNFLSRDLELRADYITTPSSVSTAVINATYGSAVITGGAATITASGNQTGGVGQVVACAGVVSTTNSPRIGKSSFDKRRIATGAFRIVSHSGITLRPVSANVEFFVGNGFRTSAATTGNHFGIVAIVDSAGSNINFYATCGGGSGNTTSLIYTLTNSSVNFFGVWEVDFVPGVGVTIKLYDTNDNVLGSATLTTNLPSSTGNADYFLYANICYNNTTAWITGTGVDMYLGEFRSLQKAS